MSTLTHHRALNAGECMIHFSTREVALAEHLISIAADNPRHFGARNSYAYWSLWTSLIRRLRGCRFGPSVLTLPQREFLHTVLAEAMADPELFGNYHKGEATLWYKQLVLSMRRQLPPRGAGTYNR